MEIRKHLHIQVFAHWLVLVKIHFQEQNFRVLHGSSAELTKPTKDTSGQNSLKMPKTISEIAWHIKYNLFPSALLKIPLNLSQCTAYSLAFCHKDWDFNASTLVSMTHIFFEMHSLISFQPSTQYSSVIPSIWMQLLIVASQCCHSMTQPNETFLLARLIIR